MVQLSCKVYQEVINFNSSVTINNIPTYTTFGISIYTVQYITSETYKFVMSYVSKPECIHKPHDC
jgi:hypothetical protein